jgi:tRNA pseudouridine55 synthase
MQRVLPELLLIDKPSGMSSFDVIRVLRKRTGVRKFGHAGTLDPAATGLLVIGVEAGTKQLNEYIKLDKEYVTEVALGESRTTGDLEGEIIEEVLVEQLAEQAVARALAEMVGTLRLPVSAYSAIKKDGVPMYKRAREAAKVGDLVKDVPVRDMVVHEAELLDIFNAPVQGVDRVIVKVRFFVGSGTYIRSLGEELGRRLGYPATLASLRRTRVGEFNVEDAQLLTDF